MRERIGVAVRAHSVRMAVVTGRRVVWSAEQPFTNGEMLDSVIAELARHVPRACGEAHVTRWTGSRRASRFRLRRVAVVLGPAWVGVRVLEGLPPLADLSRIASLVELNCDAFFPVAVVRQQFESIGAAV